MSESETRPPTTNARPRFQFSLRWLLIAITLTSLMLAILVYLGGNLVSLVVYCTAYVLFRGVIPTVAVVTAIYGRGELRAFAIGASVASIPMLAGDYGTLSIVDLFAVLVAQSVFIGICGVVAVASRRWIGRHGWDEPS